METEYEAKSGLPPPTTAGSSNRKKCGEKNKDMKNPPKLCRFGGHFHVFLTKKFLVCHLRLNTL